MEVWLDFDLLLALLDDVLVLVSVSLDVSAICWLNSATASEFSRFSNDLLAPLCPLSVAGSPFSSVLDSASSAPPSALVSVPGLSPAAPVGSLAPAAPLGPAFPEALGLVGPSPAASSASSSASSLASSAAFLLASCYSVLFSFSSSVLVIAVVDSSET